MTPASTRNVPGRHALEALFFFMADVQAGIGPFLGVFLQARGWRPGAIGAVMTLGGLVGMAATAPAGAWVDATKRKRGLVLASCLLTVLASGLLWLSPTLPAVAASQIVTALAGAVLGPALAGITLGMFRQAGFDRQFGRNQVLNHAGNVVGAALSGWLGWTFGFVAVFVLAIGFALLCMVCVLLIPPNTIDHRAARGWESTDSGGDHVSGLSVLLACKPLLVLAVALLLFHLGNAAMLPLYGLAVVAAHQGDPALFTAQTVVVAQSVMVLMSMIAVRMMRTRGHWMVLLLAFLALPVRGVIAAFLIKSWGVWPVQALDGVGAGLQSVAVPALVAHLMRGTGRVNVGQGAVMTVQGIGASLSPVLGGYIAQVLGYRDAFLLLGAVSLGSIVLWLGFARTLRATRSGVGWVSAA
jgi:MFS family permease